MVFLLDQSVQNVNPDEQSENRNGFLKMANITRMTSFEKTKQRLIVDGVSKNAKKLLIEIECGWRSKAIFPDCQILPESLFLRVTF
jgi:hypothetical protein